MNVALLVPVYEGTDFLFSLLRSLQQHWDPQIQQFVVIDNGNEKPIEAVLWRADWMQGLSQDLNAGRGIEVIRNEANRGFGPAVNQGFCAALAHPTIDAVCVMNVDQLMRENWLFWLTEALMRFPTLGMASSHLTEELSPQEFRQHAFSGLTPESPLQLLPRSKGCPWLFRRRALYDVGFFDERFEIAQFEDSDLLVRLARAGWEWAIVENSRTYHFTGSRGQTKARQVTGRDFASENRQKFQAKWGEIDMDKLMPPFQEKEGE